jgi:hypothetical protein
MEMNDSMPCMLCDDAPTSAPRAVIEERTSPVRSPTAHDARAPRRRPDVVVARWFYCDLLRGRQIWPSEGADRGAQWFHVGESVVVVHRDRPPFRAPARLVVDDPSALAERCWDAGFTVQVREAPAGGTMLVVVDPFGRELVLVARDPATSTDLIPCEESA